MPTKHAAVGGSSIERTLACPGWIKQSEGIPRTSSAAADRGTALHEVMRLAITNKQPLGMFYQQTIEGYRITSGDIGQLHIAHHQFKKLTARAEDVQLEVKVRFKENVWGTADVLAWRGYTGICIDFKFGAQPVDAYLNKQMMFYAAAALACNALPDGLKHVKMAIIQPANRPPMSHHRVTHWALAQFGAQVRDVAKVALGPNPPLRPGGQCGYCPAKPTCPALASMPRSLKDALGYLKARI